MNFNFWKNYTFSAYLSSSSSLSMSKRRVNVYVISHRQKSSSCLSKNVKFNLVSLFNSLNYQITWLQFRQQQIEKNRITKKKAEIFSCKRCSVKFSSNIKLHEHVRTKHAKKSSAISATIALFTSFIFSFISSVMSTAITSHATTFTTSRNSISWAEIASRSKSFTIFLRISRFIALSTSSFSFHLSSILQFFNSVNNITRSFFITASFATSMKSYFSMQDLYIRFHEKFRFLSFFTMQKHLSFASFSEQSMRIRQMRIISYFKSAIDSNHNFESTSTIKLASNKKHANSKSRTQTTWIDHLTFKTFCIFQDRFFSNSICFFCHYSNLSQIYDRKRCMTESQHHRKIKIM